MTIRIRVSDNLYIGDNQPLAVMAGPCLIESEEMALRIAETLKSVTDKLGISYIFKASYKKANRTNLHSFTTIGVDRALAILGKVRREIGVPVLTDIHEPHEAAAAAEVSDILQIPAFLCRQTDLIVAAAQTGRAVNLKKGQFMAPQDMAQAAEKATAHNNPNVLLTERGTSFGYHNLVVDMRGLVIMRECGCPVIFDATHSTQLPAGDGTQSGGQPEFAPVLARAALATGACDGIFIETHPDPPRAKSDARTQLPLAEMEPILRQFNALYSFTRGEQ